MMNIKNPKGVLLLDMFGTFGSMQLDLAKALIGRAVQKEFLVVIASTNQESQSIELHIRLLDLPKKMVPGIRLSAYKNTSQFYHVSKALYGVDLDKILLIDDASENVACAEESGARGLLFEGFPRPPSGRRYLKGHNPWEGELENNRTPILDAVDAMLAEMTKPPQPKGPSKAKTATPKPKPPEKSRKRNPPGLSPHSL